MGTIVGPMTLAAAGGPYGSPGGAPYGPPAGGGYGPSPGAYRPYNPPPTSSAAITAIVLGVLTMMTSCFPLGLVGFIFGVKARREARKHGEPNGSSNHMLGLIGMILSGVFGGLWALFWIFELVVVLLGLGVSILGVILAAVAG